MGRWSEGSGWLEVVEGGVGGIDAGMWWGKVLDVWNASMSVVEVWRVSESDGKM